MVDVEGKEEGDDGSNPNAEKQAPVVSILEATGGESLTEEM